MRGHAEVSDADWSEGEFGDFFAALRFD